MRDVECEWQIVESATVEGERYSIHQCLYCTAEAVVVNGHVDLKQWQCLREIYTD